MSHKSNVRIHSNVYVRNEHLHVTDDERYNTQISGRESIAIMLRAKLGRDVRIDEVCDIPALTDAQRAEFRSLRCRVCGRLDYGYVADHNGNITWRMLPQCICRMEGMADDEVL